MNQSLSELKDFITSEIEKEDSHSPPAFGKAGACVGALESLFPNDSREIRKWKRYGLLRFFLGKNTIKTCTDGECTVLLRFATVNIGDDQRPRWIARPKAILQAAEIIKYLDAEAGQGALL